LKEVADQILEAKMTNLIVDMAQTLDKPEAHDANSTKVERAIENFGFGVAVVSHLGD
jgi:hypothetical protein